MDDGDEVRLVVPARPEFLGLVRVTVAGLASRLGFTFDQIEDLRLAIDELCFGLTGTKGKDGTLEMRFVLDEEGLAVHGEGHFAAEGTTGLSELSQIILGALVDEHSLTAAAFGPRFSFVKKREVPSTRQNPPGEGQ